MLPHPVKAGKSRRLSGRSHVQRLGIERAVAASETLPLGTTARVTNLENGKSAVVGIRDRGPYVPGHIVAVTPRVAEKPDMKEDGVASVAVRPIAVPQPDGSVKPGVGATGNNR